MTKAESVSEDRNWVKLFLTGIFTVSTIILYGSIVWRFASIKAESLGRNVRHYKIYIEDKNNEQSKNQKNNVANLDENIETYLATFERATPSIKLRVKDQILTIRNRAIVHLAVVKNLYILSVVTSAVAAFTSISSGFCLLHITRRGWDRANPNVVGAFVITSSALALSTSFSIIYQFDRNIKANANLYISYVDLEEEIFTVLATKLDSQNSPNERATENSQLSQITLEQVAFRTNDILQKLHSIDLEFDLQSVPSLDEVMNQLSVE